MFIYDETKNLKKKQTNKDLVLKTSFTIKKNHMLIYNVLRNCPNQGIKNFTIHYSELEAVLYLKKKQKNQKINF